MPRSFRAGCSETEAGGCHVRSRVVAAALWQFAAIGNQCHSRQALDTSKRRLGEGASSRPNPGTA
eukprot:621963-Alexandrium_andersonii.AAC.1